MSASAVHAIPEPEHVEPEATPVAADTPSVPAAAHATPEAHHPAASPVGGTQKRTAAAALRILEAANDDVEIQTRVVLRMAPTAEELHDTDLKKKLKDAAANDNVEYIIDEKFIVPEAAHAAPTTAPARHAETPAEHHVAGETPAETPAADHAAGETPGESPAAHHADEADHAETSAHPATPAQSPKKESNTLVGVSWDAIKGVATIVTLPIALPLRLIAGTTVAIGGLIYDMGVGTVNFARRTWHRDWLYVPKKAWSGTKKVGSVVAWPFKKTWQGTKWAGKKTWGGMKWMGRKIKGIFSKAEEEEVAAEAESAPASATEAETIHRGTRDDVLDISPAPAHAPVTTPAAAHHTPPAAHHP